MPHLVAAPIYLSQIYSHYIKGDRSPLKSIQLVHWNIVMCKCRHKGEETGRAFVIHLIRGSGHAWRIYPQIGPDMLSQPETLSFSLQLNAETQWLFLSTALSSGRIVACGIIIKL